MNRRNLNTLTRQQARVLELLCDAQTPKEIAYSLQITVECVYAHLSKLAKRYNVTTGNYIEIALHAILSRDVQISARLIAKWEARQRAA